MNRRSPHPSGEESQSARLILDRMVAELEDLVSTRGVRTEEMIRIAGFFESAKALWLASASSNEPMPDSMLAHRLRVLVDICPPELKAYRERLGLGMRNLNEAEGRQKRA